jgi:hypothetical protein
MKCNELEEAQAVSRKGQASLWRSYRQSFRVFKLGKNPCVFVKSASLCVCFLLFYVDNYFLGRKSDPMHTNKNASLWEAWQVHKLGLPWVCEEPVLGHFPS